MGSMDPVEVDVQNGDLDPEAIMSRLAPPRLTWRYTYEDVETEMEQCSTELLPMCARRLRSYAVVMCCVFLALMAVELAIAGGEMTFFALLVLSASLAFGALGAVGHFFRACHLRLRHVETLAVVLLSYPVLVLATAFGKETMAEVWGAAPSRVPWLRGSSASALLRLALVPVSCMVYVPLQPVGFVALNLSILGIVASVTAAVPPGAGTLGEDIHALLVLACVCVLTSFGRTYVVHARRTQWFYRHSVTLAARDMKKLLETQRQLERAEMEHKAQIRSAEAACAARCRLIRIFMHDMRSPLLTMANVASQLHTEAGRESTNLERASSVLRTCSGLMEHILSDMLDFERMDSGCLKLEYAPCTLADITGAVHDAFAEVAREKGVTIHVRPLPPDLQRTHFLADARRVEQCLGNGVSNAIQHTPSGGTVRIQASADAGGQDGPWKVHLMVTDTGAGMDARELEVLTHGELFAAVGRGQLQGVGGAGLGLPITRSLLRLMDNAQLNLSSPGPGAGTTFEIALDLQIASEDRVVTMKRDSHSRHELAFSPPSASGLSAPEHATLSDVRRSTPTSSMPSPLNALAMPVSQRSSDPDDSVAGEAGSVSACGPQLASPHRQCRLRAAEKCKLSISCMAAPASTSLLATAQQARRWSRPRTNLPSGNTSHQPSSAPQQSSATSRSSNPAISEDCGPGVALRCLYVDDDRFLQLTFPSRVFVPLGIECDRAENGYEALELVMAQQQDTPYDLIVLDNQMPKMDGTTAAAKMRAIGFRGTIIGMTGDPEGCDERTTFEASGIDECLDKDSAGIERVIEVVKKMLERQEEGNRIQASAMKSEHASTVGLRASEKVVRARVSGADLTAECTCGTPVSDIDATVLREDGP